MNKKEKLISSLKRALHALEKDLIHYRWEEQSSCNAGVVAQCVLNIDQEELEIKRSKVFRKLEEIMRDRKETLANTWQNAVKFTCPVTGKNVPEIFRDLEAAGLSAEDIVHLEYLNNPAILEESSIEKENYSYQKIVDVVEHTVVVKKFFGLISKKEIVKEEIVENYTESKYPKLYYEKKENLIKYLAAWVRILERTNKEFEIEEHKLEAAILEAVSEENYELAAELRDRKTRNF